MKRSTKIKILTSMVCILMMVMCLSSTVLAAKSGGSGINAGDLKPIFDGDSTNMKNWAGKIMGIIRNVAVIASVIILMVIGVKFILGSTEEKAEYKKSLMPIVIGIVLVVGATTIAAFIFNNIGTT